MAKVILAVAVGENERQVTLSTENDPDFSTVRPYIVGLRDWLASQNRTNPPEPDNNPPRYRIPGDYSIIYRERPVGIANLKSAFQDQTALQADLWFCMLTSVARAADEVAKAQEPKMPIVAIVSDPYSEGFGDNVCGVSANRDRLAVRCMRYLKRRVGAQNIFVLLRQGYDPSDRAYKWLDKRHVTPIYIADGDSTQTMKDKITAIKNSPLAKKGVLVLAADRFFGVAKLITEWTDAIPTFWLTPDFPMEAKGGYGYPQKRCGQYMAERVATIWKNQADSVEDPIPDPKWEAMDRDDLDLRIRA